MRHCRWVSLVILFIILIYHLLTFNFMLGFLTSLFFSSFCVHMQKQDAAGLTQLSATVEDVFASGDLPRAAETLANMRHCLSAVGEVAICYSFSYDVIWFFIHKVR